MLPGSEIDRISRRTVAIRVEVMSSALQRFRNTILQTLVTLISAAACLAAMQAGTLRGRLSSSDGSSVSGIRVAAMFADDGRGRILGTTTTDEQGRYSLEMLQPGRYYIVAGMTDAPFYYPGVRTSTEAQAVTVGTGAISRAFDFVIRKVGVTLSGKVILAMRQSSPLTISLSGNGSSREVSASGLGVFEFNRVLPGTYRLSVSPDVGIPPLTITVASADLRDLQLKPETLKVYDVSGRIVPQNSEYPPIPGPREVTLLPRGSSMNAAPSSPAVIRPDGTFTVQNVLPGTYTVYTLPQLLSPEIAITVIDRSISGLEIPVMRQIPLNIHIAMDDGALLPVLNGAQAVRLQLITESTRLSGSIGPDGTSRSFIAPGRNYLFLTPPPGYFLTSLTSGNTDLFRGPITVAPSATEVRVEGRIGRSPLVSQPSVRVKGRMTGNHSGVAVQLVNGSDPANRSTLTTFTTTDGTFEFSTVSPGVYSLTIPPAISPIQPNIIVIGKDVEGLEIPLPPGNIIIGQLMGIPPTAPAFPEKLAVEFESGGERKRVDLMFNYGFIYALPAGIYKVSIQGLPAGFSVKSMSAGSTDLLTFPLQVEEGKRLSPIQFLLDYKDPSK